MVPSMPRGGGSCTFVWSYSTKEARADHLLLDGYHHGTMLFNGRLESDMGQVVIVSDALWAALAQALVSQAFLCWAESPAWDMCIQ